jgi:hypothetical protein
MAAPHPGGMHRPKLSLDQIQPGEPTSGLFRPRFARRVSNAGRERPDTTTRSMTEFAGGAGLADAARRHPLRGNASRYSPGKGATSIADLPNFSSSSVR